jgi:uncharacterized protein
MSQYTSGPAGVVDTTDSSYARLMSVPVADVKMEQGFWRPRMEANVKTSIPRLLELLEEHGVVDNFRRLTGSKQAERLGPRFTDSDLYKWLEAAAIALQSRDLPQLRRSVDDITAEIAAAQEPDGYLNTWFVGELATERFDSIEAGHSHELYCAGHLMQAAVARYRADGNEKLLDVACRFADLLVSEFGPGGRTDTDGHPEIEMALIELYRATGRQEYLDLAGSLLARPQASFGFAPIATRSSLVGHCVRSGYLCCGGADYYAETGDEMMLTNLKHLWEDLVNGKIYLTGGVGAHYREEEFGESYELPNLRAYAETCAQIAHFMWGWRMLLATGEARFAEVMETIIYNGFLSGVSLSGSEYFYSNPLAANTSWDEQDSLAGSTHPGAEGGWTRQEWWPCTCCPPNVERTIAAIPGHLFSTSAEGIWMHFYDACRAQLVLENGTPVELEVATTYPWQGAIRVVVNSGVEAAFSLMLRIPYWAQGATATINGEAASVTPEPGSYLQLERTWQPGDVVELTLPMEIRFIESHPYVAENRGSIAIQRGPIVYCFEGADNPTVAMPDLRLDGGKLCTAEWHAEHKPELLGGVTVISGPGLRPVAGPTNEALYADLGTRPDTQWEPVMATAIPYYAWANRDETGMRVWLPFVQTWQTE